MTTEQKQAIKPAEALGWVTVAFLVAALAWATGQMVGNVYDTPMAWFVKGLLALVLAGYAASAVAGWFRKAVRGY